MAPAKNKWIRRFIITEIKRHKKGFTIYKVTSVVFLKSSHEEVSKVSVWKRYNDFKKLHSELSNLHKRLGIKESFPILPKSKYFGRFEAEVVEERKKYALKFLEFVGRYSYLYSSDVFITFFETSHVDNYNDCAHSLNSDTSEDDHIVTVNDSVLTNDTTAQGHFQVSCRSRTSHNILINPCSPLSNTTCTTNENGFTKSWRKNESHNTTNLENINIKKEDQSYKKSHVQDVNTKDYDTYKGIKNLETNDKTILCDVSGFDNLNSNINKHLSTSNIAHSTRSITLHKKENLSQSDSTQYLLIAAAHMSAAFKHESIAEYEEAFTQYKLGISCLINGVQFDPDSTRVPSIKDKISKYLARAEQLYNRHLNCNISIVSKSVSDLQYYKVLKVMRSVMLVMDIRTNCKRIIKTVEKSSVHENKISDYILRGQIPHMVHLHACVETETTVFLILQYASCGKLWDFIRLHYKTSDNLHNNIISNHICTNKYVNEKLDSNENIHESTDKTVKNKLQSEDDQYLTDIRNEIYLEVPTMQLLENSQKLLKSVNATLMKSNSITSRLNDFKELKHSGNISLPNTKAVTQISQESDLISSDVYRNKSLNNNIDNILIKNFIENKNSEAVNPLSRNNNKNSLKNKKSDPYRDNSSLKNISTQNISTNNTIYAYKNNDTGSRPDRINSSNVNCTDETPYPHLCKDNIDEEEKFWQIPEGVIQSWTTEIILALEALHQQDILIFDFKPDNILLDEAGHIQLTYITPQHNVELSKLTHPYSSPELTMFSPLIPITSATDIWSLGVILYELFTGTTFVTKHPGLFHSHSTINIPNKLTESAKSLLYGMLKYHPDERLTIDEIKRHPFFAGIDWFSKVNSQT